MKSYFRNAHIQERISKINFNVKKLCNFFNVCTEVKAYLLEKLTSSKNI
mgnify:CR=1 FL=1